MRRKAQRQRMSGSRSYLILALNDRARTIADWQARRGSDWVDQMLLGGMLKCAEHGYRMIFELVDTHNDHVTREINAALVALQGATTLRPDWPALFAALPELGGVMALTRNEHIVHEKIGVYRNVSAKGPVGLAIGPEIDLRLFLNHWHAGFHVVERSDRGEQHSLQFFDRHGQAVHKVHARPQTSLSALEDLVQRHADPTRDVRFEPGQHTPPTDRPDSEIDCLGLGEAGSALRDTHGFFELLKRFQVGRRQALRLMEGVHTRRTPLLAVDWLLNEAAASGLPIMVFVGNPGCIQIHTGKRPMANRSRSACGK